MGMFNEYLAQELVQERLRQSEGRKLARLVHEANQATRSSNPRFAPHWILLGSAGQVLIVLGQWLQHYAQPQVEPEPQPCVENA